MPEAAPTRAKDKDPMLSHGAHEIRNPVSVIAGYVKMLTGDRMGPTTAAQRKILGEIAVSAGRLAKLAAEMSSLSLLVAGAVRFNRAPLDLASLIETEIVEVAAVPERDTAFRVINEARGAPIEGDEKELRSAFNSLMFAQARELVTSNELCIALDRATFASEAAVRVTIGGADQIEKLRRVSVAELVPFVEFRGGIGFSLSIAAHIIQAHGGQILSKLEPREDPKATPSNVGSVLFLPQA